MKSFRSLTATWFDVAPSIQYIQVNLEDVVESLEMSKKIIGLITLTFPFIHSMLNHRKIFFFWCKIHEMSCFLFDEFGYEINFEYFWKSLLFDAAMAH